MTLTKDQAERRFALIVNMVGGTILGLAGYEILPSFKSWLVYLVFLGLICRAGYRYLTSGSRHRKALTKNAFPAEWDEILETNVAFYHALSPNEKSRFQTEISIFLADKKITGVNTEIDDTDRLFVAASAIIPVFGFPDWEYDTLKEVLLYPGNFTQEFSQEGKKDRNVVGMVGNGFMNGVMILSKPRLRYSFLNPTDRENVGIHEFIHLIDKDDGAIDGLPESLVDKQYVLPWLELMQKEIWDIKKGKSNINPYGATNKEEFLAVAGEYFFERPTEMKEQHPELYKMLEKIFHQKMSQRLKNKLKSFLPKRRTT